MNAIFLDIDGVLNSNINSKSHCGDFAGIDKDKVTRLAKIVRETNSIIILISSWKNGWQPNRKYKVDEYNIYNIPYSNYHAKYLDNHLRKKGNLIITDKTKERNPEMRGTGIRNFLSEHPDIKNWVVLDDEIFYDYREQNIIPHLIKINPEYGLTDNDAETAIKMLQIQSS